MNEDNRADRELGGINRRDFVKTGGVLLVGGVASGRSPLAALEKSSFFPVKPSQEGRVQSYRTLGRTGFRVSDVSLGGSFLRDPSLVRYAVEKGMNYIDTAENYENGGADRAIRGALPHLDRETVFIATNADVSPREDKDSVLARARRTLERLNTEYVDAYMMGMVGTVEWLQCPGYHAAMDQLKAEGRVKFTGVTCHGAEATDQAGMGDVLCAAAEDGRFDVMLLVYNFLNHSEGDRVLAAAQANNLGTTAMKTAPGKLRADPLDPDNLTEVFQQYLTAMTRSGMSHEAALRQLREYSDAQNQFVAGTQAFAERYGIDNERALRLASIQWVLQNPDMHTTCISAGTFDFIDEVVALSGTRLTPPAEGFLQEAGLTLDEQYCRHGCAECLDSCPHEVPVSRIMRYAYYFEGQGRERHAMAEYAALDGTGAEPCKTCPGFCAGACPHGVSIHPNMLRAHDLLTLA